MVTLLLIALLGCRQSTPDVKDSGSIAADDRDADEDGFSLSEGDCDDTDPSTFPSAVEQCDGVDQDCDGEIDEGVTQTWYGDADRDGYGSQNATTTACEQPPDTSDIGTDCDDTTAEVYPGASEVCDGLDNDCNELVDDGVTVRWFVDADADGWGDAASEAEGCEPPMGAVDVAGDCDDTRVDVYPGNVEACDEVDNNCDGAVDEGVTATFWVDFDGDAYGDATLPLEACTQPTGYAARPDDCDDGADAVNPGASERCNGEDDDCDGTVDEPDATDSITWYEDADTDGYGGRVTMSSCEQPDGYVASSSDCDDTNAAISPAAAERCNAVDDDCDGTTDEDDAVDATTWYLDFDADGYGSSRLTAVSCAARSGYVAASTDCDDTDASINPAATETCDDVDEDCDGTADDGVTTYTWYRDADGDTYGTSSSPTVDCAAPSGTVSRAGDCNDGSSSISPSATEVCNGVDDDCDGTIDNGTADTDGDGVCDAIDAETCDGMDNDGDGSADESLTCTYQITRSDLTSGLCVDDDLIISLDGVNILYDWDGGSNCHAALTFTATPGQTLRLAAYDTYGVCRTMDDVYIVNVAGGVGQRLTTGYTTTCGHGASTTAFWSRTVTVPGEF